MSTEEMVSAASEQLENTGVSDEISQKYLTFISDGLDFGIKASYISEILTNQHITILPLLPSYIKGIINMRGMIIPIIDIRIKMGKSPAEPTNHSFVIVLNINSMMLGVYVDTVSLVTDIDESEIAPPSPTNRQELVNGMVSMADGKTLLLIDCEKLAQA